MLQEFGWERDFKAYSTDRIKREREREDRERLMKQRAFAEE